MSMNCFACIKTCPNTALEIDQNRSCVRLEESSPLRVDKEKCDECDQCNEVCPTGDIALAGKGCMFCIVCKSSPSCLVPSIGDRNRGSFLNFLASIARYMMVRCRIIFQ